MTKDKKNILFDNTARNLNGVPKSIQLRHLKHCFKADPAYGEGIGKLLGVEVSEFSSK